jgi:hypothetical protein
MFGPNPRIPDLVAAEHAQLRTELHFLKGYQVQYFTRALAATAVHREDVKGARDAALHALHAMAATAFHREDAKGARGAGGGRADRSGPGQDVLGRLGEWPGQVPAGWSINLWTFAGLSATSLWLAWLDNRSVVTTPWLVAAGVVAVSFIHNVSVAGQLTSGTYSYTCSRVRWIDAMESDAPPGSKPPAAHGTPPAERRYWSWDWQLMG